MTDRPLGIYVACAFLGLVGFAILVSALNLWGRSTTPETPDAVRLYLTVVPIFGVILGLLGPFAAVTLWTGSPVGRLGGLVWAALWAAGELVAALWAVTGPEIVREASDGPGATFVRTFVAVVLFYYLWTVGASYVEGDRRDAPTPSLSTEH